MRCRGQAGLRGLLATPVPRPQADSLRPRGPRKGCGCWELDCHRAYSVSHLEEVSVCLSTLHTEDTLDAGTAQRLVEP